LLSILFLIETLEKQSLQCDAGVFNDATYFDRVIDSLPIDIRWPAKLIDIALRWRMYHFHHYCSVALESLFAYIVAEAQLADVNGVTFANLLAELNSRTVSKKIAASVGWPVDLEMTIEAFLRQVGVNGSPTNPRSIAWDAVIRIEHPLSERNLESLLRDGLIGSAAGGVIAAILLLISLLRFLRWREQPYGNWLAQSVRDDYLDITTVVLLKRLNEKFGEFSTTPMRDILDFLLHLVVLQHEAMSYTKSADGTTAFFHTDQNRIYPRTIEGWRVKVTNGRFYSALQILLDIGFVAEHDEQAGVYNLTSDGHRCLKGQLTSARDT
jgi:hypothetical protein